MKNPAQAGRVRGLLDGIVIDNARAQHLNEVLEFLLAHSATNPNKLKCALLVGPSQSGKTTMIEAFVQRYNTPEALSRGEIPILPVILQEDATRKQLYQNVLSTFDQFGYADTSIVGTEAVLLRRIHKYLHEAQVRLLVIDEFHHCVHSNSHKLNESIGEAIKGLLHKRVCPILMAGIERARLPFEENNQLAHRTHEIVELQKLDLHDQGDSKLYMEFLARFLLRVESSGAAVNARTLLADDIASRIFEAADGVLGVACNIIKSAVQSAAGDERGAIELTDLALAIDQLVARKRSKTNPFGVANQVSAA